jgi:hypothetical protein
VGNAEDQNTGRLEHWNKLKRRLKVMKNMLANMMRAIGAALLKYAEATGATNNQDVLYPGFLYRGRFPHM